MRSWLRALVGAIVVVGIAIAGLSYAYWDQTVLIGSMPRDAKLADNAIAKLNRYRDQREDEKLPTALPTTHKTRNGKTEKAS
jgi:hypothetical protein